MNRPKPKSDVTSLVKAVERRFGLRLHEGFHTILAARAFQIVGQYNTRSFEDIVRRLEIGDNLDPLVVSMKQAATISETYFFRAPKQMMQLERIVRMELAPILRQRRQRTLRVWSSACSSGEEPYTLAILLKRAAPDFRLQIVGTDINRAALNLAREGIYGRRSFRGVDPAKLPGLRKLDEQTWTVTSELRRMVSFVELNLALDEFPSKVLGIGNFDVILCRNVLIYIHEEKIPGMMQKLANAASPNAVIVLSAAEYIAGRYLKEFEGRPGGFWFRSDLRPKTGLASPGVHKKRAATPPPPPELARLPVSELTRVPKQAAPGPPVDTAIPPPPIELLARAKQAADRGELETAIRLSEQAVRHNPALPEPHYLMGVAHAELQNPTRAVQEFERALFYDRDYIAARISLGHLLAEQGRDEAALRHLTHARSKLEQLPPADIVPGIELSASAAIRLVDLALEGAFD